MYVKDNQVYVASYHANKIYEDGVFIGVKTTQNQPVGLAVDNYSKLYISEGTTEKIHVNNSNGTKSHIITGIGTYPRKIQFDLDGNLHVKTFYKVMCILLLSLDIILVS